MADGSVRKMLDERAAAPDIQHLGTEADGKDRLRLLLSGLKQQGVDLLALRVGIGGIGIAGLSEAGGINIGSAAGEENCVAGGGQLGGYGRVAKRNCNRLAARALDCLGVLRPGALVVLRV